MDVDTTATHPRVDDPVIVAGLALHGMTPDTIEWRLIHGEHEATFLARDGRPRLEIRGDYMWMAWVNGGRHRVRYERHRGAAALHQVTVSDIDIADCMIPGLIEGPLSRVVDMPGGNDLIITGIHVEKLGEFRNTVIRLRDR
jgi:hypothetical protein